MNELQLGEILHVFNGEAICHPDTAFRATGSLVICEERKIGKLGDPFGQVARPYQPIILFEKIKPESVIGKKAIALKKRKRRRRYKKSR